MTKYDWNKEQEELNQKLADSYLAKAEADVEIVKLKEQINSIDEELDNVQCENATFRDENVELDDLRAENSRLRDKNEEYGLVIDRLKGKF